MAAQEHNRCLWRVVGQVTFVRKVLVTLRCSLCQVCAVTVGLEQRCPRCGSKAHLAALWEATLAFDDGTAESDLHVEGLHALAMIRSRYDPSGLMLSKTQQMVEFMVRRQGRFVFDAVFQWSAAHPGRTSADSCADEMAFDFEALEETTLMLPAAVRLADCGELSESLAAFQRYLASCRFGCNFEVYCSVSHQQLGAQRAAAPAKKVSLQSANSDLRHLINFTTLPSQVRRKLRLEGFDVRELTSDALRLAAWQLLNN